MCGKNSEGVRQLPNRRLFIYGAGGLGREVAELAKQISPGFDLAFIDDAAVSGYLGVPVFSCEEAKQYAQANPAAGVIASGEPAVVGRLKERLTESGIALQTLIHPSVYIPESCLIGKGVVVQDRVYVGPNVSLGDACCINYNCGLGHDVSVESCVIIAMGTMLGGNCVIGEGTYIGNGAVIRNGIKIGKNSIIGMGSVVTQDIPDGVVAYGSPCRVIRENTGRVVFKRQ